MTKEQRQLRIRKWRNSAAIAAFLSFCGVIGVWFGLVWLAYTFPTESRYLEALGVSAAFVIPVTIAFVSLRYSQRLARRLELVCPHCGTALSASLTKSAFANTQCSHCGKETLNEAA